MKNLNFNNFNNKFFINDNNANKGYKLNLNLNFLIMWKSYLFLDIIVSNIKSNVEVI